MFCSVEDQGGRSAPRVRAAVRAALDMRASFIWGMGYRGGLSSRQLVLLSRTWQRADVFYLICKVF